MASRYSKIQSSIWGSDKFNAVNEFAQKVYMYFLCCPHGNSAGFFKIPDGYAITDLRCSMQKYKIAKRSLSQIGLIEYDGEIVLVKQFLRFNPYTNDSHAKGSQKEIAEFENNLLYVSFYNEVLLYCLEYKTAFNNPANRLSRDCREGVERLSRDCREGESTNTNTNTNNQDQDISVPDGTPPDESPDHQEPDPYQDIFNHYMTLRLIKHRSLTKEMRNAIDVARRRSKEDHGKGYTWDELKTLLDRHAQIVKLTAQNGEYKVRARPLVEFFGQKVKDGTALICSEYADDGAKWLRYKDGDSHKPQDKTYDDISIGAKPSYFERPIENYDYLAVDFFADDEK